MGTNNFSISNVFFSKAQQQVLGLLFSKPDSDFYTNEIIRSANSGTGAIQRELAKLASAKIILVKQVGNQKRYQANKDLPFFLELHGIILKTFGLADIIRETLNPLENHIQFAFIYGSTAKQEDKAESDVDLMIIGDNLTYADLFQHLKNAEERLNRPINPSYYTLSEWSNRLKKENNFVLKILQQPKIFLIGNENEFIKTREPSKNRRIKKRTL